MSEIKLLTSAAHGHTLHHHAVFSKDNTWIVFDGRNADSKIGENRLIGIVHVETGEERVLYALPDASDYGPGLGAASFNPLQDRVVFIHGLSTASAELPYDITRRRAVAVDLSCPGLGIPLDGRDLRAPYSAGTLRGGTHSHAWDAKGELLSFTYNDALVEPDLRMVGVMVPKADAISDASLEIQGQLYAAIVSEVHANPQAGSDQISRAFDECWLGDTQTIAFQGHTKNHNGDCITEIYTVAIDVNLIQQDQQAVGLIGQRPQVPKGMQQQRLSFTAKGLSPLRHWLRASPDGQYIYALAQDDAGRNQLVCCSKATGILTYISDFPFSISSPINISYAGDQLVFIANNQVYCFSLKSEELLQLTKNEKESLLLSGVPVFSRDDQIIAYNQYVETAGVEFLQIKLIYR